MYSATLRRSPLPMLALLALAIGLTLTLVPHGREMALLRLAAGDSRGAVAALEQMVAAGDRSPATLSALARALARTGDVAAAAQVLERLAEERPGDQAVLEALAGLQRDAGRTAGLIGTLQSLQAIAPTVEWQRELADLLGKAGRSDDRRQALRELVRNFPAQPVDYVNLARAELEAGDPAAGALVLQQLAMRTPSAADASVVALHISMLLAAGQPEQALQRGGEWLAGRSDLGVVAPIIGGALSVGGRPDLAIRLLQPYAAPGADPDLIAALAQAETDAGQPEQGLRRLEQLGTTLQAMGSGKTALLRLRLALALQEADRAMTAAEIVGLQQVPPDLLASLSRAFLTGDRIDALRHILGSVGSGFLQTDTVLAAQIFLAVGDAAAARQWSDRAAQVVLARPEQAVALATVELRLGRTDRRPESAGTCRRQSGIAGKRARRCRKTLCSLRACSGGCRCLRRIAPPAAIAGRRSCLGARRYSGRPRQRSQRMVCRACGTGSFSRHVARLSIPCNRCGRGESGNEGGRTIGGSSAWRCGVALARPHPAERKTGPARLGSTTGAAGWDISAGRPARGGADCRLAAGGGCC
jgi:tetratricopeptide (TPR) repeat protein